MKLKIVPPWERAKVKPNQSRDGHAHLTYFDARTQASFAWDGMAAVIEVSIGGYGEPVDHTISAPSDMMAFYDTLETFEAICKGHAVSLHTYGRD